MNKSSREYQRRLTTNSYNQDFVYYKQQYSKQYSKSPKFKVHQKDKQTNRNKFKEPFLFDKDSNHNKIQSMKNTLQNLYSDKSISSKNYNKSVVQYPTYQQKNMHFNNELRTKSVFGNEENQNNKLYNNKLQMLTSKLREIAQKPYYHNQIIKQQQQQQQKLLKSNKSNTNNLSYSQKNFTQKNKKIVNIYNVKNYINKKQHFINEQSKSTYLANQSQQLGKSRYHKDSNNINPKITTISQTTSLKRNQKQLKNQKSISTFQYKPNQQNLVQRPRGKTMINYIQQNQMDIQNAKIKINSYLQSSKNDSYLQSSHNTQRYSKFDHLTSVQLKQQTRNLVNDFNKLSKKNISKQIATNISKQKSNKSNYQKQNLLKHIKTLYPHRGAINSIIINSDCQRFLTASNDYTIKQSILNGESKILRKHEGRVNVIRMIQNRLYSGSNDCKIKYQQNTYDIFPSPIVQIYPHEKQWLNIGTKSSIQLFNLEKRKTNQILNIKNSFYQLFQKINKQIFYSDHHNLSIIDWRVPYPLISILQQKKYVNRWVSNPYSMQFYQIIQNNLISPNNKLQTPLNLTDYQIKDYTWKKDKLFILTQYDLKILQTKNNNIQLKQQIRLNEQTNRVSSLQVKNEMWTYGTLNGQLIVNRFQ